MKILALDLGKSKTVAYHVDTETGEAAFKKVPTRPSSLAALAKRWRPQRVVFEIGPLAGWIKDLMAACGVPEIQVANVASDAWRWRNVKRKTDRTDAMKLLDLSASDRLPTVHVPEASVRGWRALIAYRARLVGRRTAMKNRIRALLATVAETLPAGKKGWTAKERERLEGLARPLEACARAELWRGQLALELEGLDRLGEQIEAVEAKLDALAEADERVKRLRTIPGVGARLAEQLVALIDDPSRFRSGKQVAGYLGLVPRQFQSGRMDRHGRITGHGNRLARSLLVEVSWLGLRWNPRLRAIYERVHRGSRVRRKVAIVAVARHLAIIAWAMLRDGTTWQAPRAAETPAAVLT